MKRLKRIIGILLACAIIVISCQKVSFAETFNETKALNNITFEFFQEDFGGNDRTFITVEATSNYDFPVSITITCQFISNTTGELLIEKVQRAEYLEKGHSFYFTFPAYDPTTQKYIKDYKTIDEFHNTTIKVEKGLKNYLDAESVLDKVSITPIVPTEQNCPDEPNENLYSYKFFLTKKSGKQMTCVIFNIKYTDTSTGKVYRRTCGWGVNEITDSSQQLVVLVPKLGAANITKEITYDKVEADISMAYYIPE